MRKERTTVIQSYKRGLLHGLPIALGYVSVSFAFGIQAVAVAGLHPWQALLLSLCNVTSAGQMAGLSVMAQGGSLVETALTQATVNLRYALMGLSLSQKLDESMTLFHRMTIAFCHTDEVFAVASGQPGQVGRAYLYGLTNGPYLGWATGTLLGAIAGGALPPSLAGALGIAMYGMFIAIMLPPFRRQSNLRLAVLAAVGMSCLFTYVPLFSLITDGFRIIICAVAASALAAWLMPMSEEATAVPSRINKPGGAA
ncbi:MAG: AzlC family ABC transporter permease [Clostridia bacterium]|nr:AzlC family ABC transporter permease [Clostridia bacterium]